MAQYSCIVQRGQEPERQKDILAQGLKKIGQQMFGDDPEETEIQWASYGEGYAWTAGEASTSSIVIRSVPVGLPNDKREQFLRSVCDLWIAETGCSMNEIVVTAWDGPIPRA